VASDAGGTWVRAATIGDVPRLTEIYNHYILETPITFDIEVVAPEQRRVDWFEHYAETGPHRLLVLEEHGEVLGYASSSPWRPKRAYETTVETSIYLAPHATGRGLGTRLYTALFEALKGEPVHMALAGITLPNDVSVALHRRFGFEEVGTFREIGWKLGRYWDVLMMVKRLREGGSE
jgi:phosphinothricin acetyltransferase